MRFKTNAFAQTATRVAHLAHGAGLLAVVAMAWMPQTMRAQEGSDPWVFDDFSTAGGKLEATSGPHSVNQTSSEIIGGTRSISLNYTASDPSKFGQESTLQVRPSSKKQVPSALIWSNGFDATPLIDLQYFGLDADTPLNLNLTN
jgi:hypothetical protein